MREGGREERQTKRERAGMEKRGEIANMKRKRREGEREKGAEFELRAWSRRARKKDRRTDTIPHAAPDFHGRKEGRREG